MPEQLFTLVIRSLYNRCSYLGHVIYRPAYPYTISEGVRE